MDAGNELNWLNVIRVLIMGAAAVVGLVGLVVWIPLYVQDIIVALQPISVDILNATIYVKPIAGGFNVTAVIAIRNPNPFNITVSGISADLGDVCGGGLFIFFRVWRCKTSFPLWNGIDVPANTTKVITVSMMRSLAVTVTNTTVVTLSIYRSELEMVRIAQSVTVHAKVIFNSGDRSPV